MTFGSCRRAVRRLPGFCLEDFISFRRSYRQSSMIYGNVSKLQRSSWRENETSENDVRERKENESVRSSPEDRNASRQTREESRENLKPDSSAETMTEFIVQNARDSPLFLTILSFSINTCADSANRLFNRFTFLTVRSFCFHLFCLTFFSSLRVLRSDYSEADFSFTSFSSFSQRSSSFHLFEGVMNTDIRYFNVALHRRDR